MTRHPRPLATRKAPALKKPHSDGPAEGHKSALALQHLSAWISARGLKSTRQRDLIVDTFFQANGHVSVGELLERVLQRDTRIGAATVYRTMKILTEAGLASPRHFDDGQTRYEAALDRHHHDHLICTCCHKIVEFENERIERLQDAVAAEHGFVVLRHKMELYGVCRACRPRPLARPG